jgi:DNA-binding beta-propeller fold protein YncE
MGLSSGTIIYSFQVPPPMQVGGWITGLAYDGTGLWVADYNSSYLYKLNPDNGSYITYLPAPGGTHVYDIAYDPNDGNLWVNNMGNDRIYKINSSNGSIIQLFYSPATNASGLTFDGTYLWITEYSSNIIYRVNPQNGSILGTYYLPYSGDGSREIAIDGSGPDGGSIIHTRVFYTGSFDSSCVYEWNRITHTPTGNKFKLNFNIRGVEWDPNTGDYWIAEPHSSVRGYIHRVIGFNYPPVGVQEKEKVKEKRNISINSNIFKGKIRLELSIPQKINLKIEVFDALGRRVKTLHKGDLKKGEHVFDFRPKSSGIYFILVRSDEFAKVLKITEVSHD